MIFTDFSKIFLRNDLAFSKGKIKIHAQKSLIKPSDFSELSIYKRD